MDPTRRHEPDFFHISVILMSTSDCESRERQVLSFLTLDWRGRTFTWWQLCWFLLGLVPNKFFLSIRLENDSQVGGNSEWQRISPLSTKLVSMKLEPVCLRDGPYWELSVGQTELWWYGWRQISVCVWMWNLTPLSFGTKCVKSVSSWKLTVQLLVRFLIVRWADVFGFSLKIFCLVQLICAMIWKYSGPEVKHTAA